MPTFMTWIKAAPFLGLLILGSYTFYLKSEISDCEKEKIEIVSKGVTTYAKTQKEVMRLSDPDLDGRLAKWMRD